MLLKITLTAERFFPLLIEYTYYSSEQLIKKEITSDLFLYCEINSFSFTREVNLNAVFLIIKYVNFYLKYFWTMTSSEGSDPYPKMVQSNTQTAS